MSGSNSKRSVLFVCLGNICRSPIAEAVFCQLLQERGLRSEWRVDSAATSTYEIGNKPDRRGRKLMKDKGVEMSHVARQITKRDYLEFDFVFGMDDDNLSNLRRMRPSEAKCVLDYLGSFDPQGEKIIHDPYYGDEADFVHVYEQCLRCCRAFLDKNCK